MVITLSRCFLSSNCQLKGLPLLAYDRKSSPKGWHPTGKPLLKRNIATSSYPGYTILNHLGQSFESLLASHPLWLVTSILAPEVLVIDWSHLRSTWSSSLYWIFCVIVVEWRSELTEVEFDWPVCNFMMTMFQIIDVGWDMLWLAWSVFCGESW